MGSCAHDRKGKITIMASSDLQPNPASGVMAVGTVGRSEPFVDCDPRAHFGSVQHHLRGKSISILQFQLIDILEGQRLLFLAILWA